MTLGLPDRPPRAPRQRGSLTEECDGLQPYLFAEELRTTAASTISDRFAVLNAHNPSANRSPMAIGESSNPTRLNSRVIKRGDLYPLVNPRGRRDLSAPYQGQSVGQPFGFPAFYLLNDFTEFFLNLKEDSVAIP